MRKKKEEERFLGAEGLDDQVAYLSNWYFKNFDAKLEPSSNEKLESYLMGKIMEKAVDVFFLISLGRIKLKNFIFGFTLQKRQYSNRQD